MAEKHKPEKNIVDPSEDEFFESQSFHEKNNEPTVIECDISMPRWVKGESLFRIDGHRDYTITVIWQDNKSGTKKTSYVQRRYTDFEWLQEKLLSNMSECAIPLLPDRSIYDKFKDNNSEFVKDRIRGLQHFLTIMISHQNLKTQKSVTNFLTEDKETFKARLEKEKKEKEDEEKKKNKSSGWLSSARNSFSGLLTRAREATIDRISSFISKGEIDDDEEEIKINKIENYLNRLKSDFELIILTFQNFCKIRYEEAQIDNFFNEIMNSRNEFEDQTVNEHLK